VNTPLLFAQSDLSSSANPYNLSVPPKRTLGCAILVAAINDYRGSDSAAHRTAETFLFPKSLESQQRYDWVVSMAPGVDPQWLRHALDRCKPKWDRERFEEELRTRRQRGRAL
jgi:hypothetical protein